MNVYSTRLYNTLPISLSLVLDINNQRHLSNWMSRFVQVTRALHIATEWIPISRSSFPRRSSFNFRWGTHAIKCYCLALLSWENDSKRIKTGDVLFSVMHLVYTAHIYVLWILKYPSPSLSLHIYLYIHNMSKGKYFDCVYIIHSIVSLPCNSTYTQYWHSNLGNIIPW